MLIAFATFWPRINESDHVAPLMSPRRLLETERLRLVASEPEQACAVCDFNARNRLHFAPWDPPRDESFFQVESRRNQLQQDATSFAAGIQWRWWIFLADDPSRIVGFVHYSQVHLHAFCSAMLGYAMDSALEGRGLMREAIAATIDETFSESVGLHRIQANVLPDNTRSLALLDRLQFRREGLAKDYLYINGRWRDHVLTARLNPTWRESKLSAGHRAI